MAEIVLAGGMIALIDDDDVDLISGYSWKYRPPTGRSGAYVIRHQTSNGVYKTIYLHRFLLAVEDGIEVDHKNCNGLDNRRSNLRIANRTLNEANKVYSPGVSGARGVHPSKNGKWRAKIEVRGIVHGLGTFRSVDEAALAYDEAARTFFGEFARLNFPRLGEMGAFS